MAREQHHILHDRISWESRRDGEELRRDKSLIVPLEHDVHAELHRETPAVPLLGYFALRRVNSSYEAGTNYLENVENLQRSIEEAGNSPKAHYVEKQVGELTIHVLELQKPFIADAYSTKRYL